MADINKFTVVYVDGADSSLAQVKKWDGGSAAPTLDKSRRILGVTLTDSNAAEKVAVMKRGYIRSVTPGGSPSAGDLLWAQADGSVSKTKPTPPLSSIYKPRGPNRYRKETISIVPVISNHAAIPETPPPITKPLRITSIS